MTTDYSKYHSLMIEHPSSGSYGLLFSSKVSIAASCGTSAFKLFLNVNTCVAYLECDYTGLTK